MEHSKLIPHLFRTEYRKIVSVLCKRFGFEQIETAEDIASDTFFVAAQTWSMNGLPENPVAWLYYVAKNKAKNHLQRNALFTSRVVTNISSKEQTTEIDLSEQNIYDSQLQMMFAICHPAIAPEAQIGLALRILCGFGIDEIAAAFLSNKETINKRLYRAKEKLRAANIAIELPPAAEIDVRLPAVLTSIYLLFSEGYYSASHDTVMRKELCLEAMRLCRMLTENDSTNKPEANALLALMCFHASRFDARVNQQGDLVLYHEQDTSLWNEGLIAEGAYYLKKASGGAYLSQYHCEAAIAYWHTQKADTAEKWETILQLHNILLQIVYSPIAALNRTYALSKVKGKKAAIAEAEKLKMEDNHFYFTLLGVLYADIDTLVAKQHLERALQLAQTQPDKEVIRKKITSLNTN